MGLTIVRATERHSPRFNYVIQGYALWSHRDYCLRNLKRGYHLVRRMSEHEGGATLLTTSTGSDLFERFGTAAPALLSTPEKSAAIASPLVELGNLAATIFPPKTERIKCFVIDGRFAFSKSGRESQKKSYSKTMFIALTEMLYNYFEKYIYPDQGPPGARLDAKYSENPRFKIENWLEEEENYTIAIPAGGWSAFWRNVDSFAIEDGDKADIA